MTGCLKSAVMLLGVATLGAQYAVVRSAQAQAFDPAAAAFGYTNGDGSMLLTRDGQDEQLSDARATVLVQAVCADGEVFRISYLGSQPGNTANNYRDSASNFANAAGQLFDIVNGGARPDGSCLLVPEGFLAQFRMLGGVNGTSSRSSAAGGPATPGPAEQREINLRRLAAARERNIESYTVLSRLGPELEVAAVYYEPDGDKLLAAVVLLADDQLSFLDMPATRDEYSCWSVDDGCDFRAERMQVPAVFESARGERLLFLINNGTEGQALVLLQARDGVLVELRRSGRYQAPI